MDYKDYYKILGIDRKANEDDIRTAYRKLAKQYHPDRNPNDKQAEEHFKEINEAYQVLSDPKKRAHYDRLGSDYSNWQQRGTPGNFNWGQYEGFPEGTRVDFGDINDMFGGGGFSDFFRTIFGMSSEGVGTRSTHPPTDPGISTGTGRSLWTKPIRVRPAVCKRMARKSRFTFPPACVPDRRCVWPVRGRMDSIFI